MLKNRFIKFLVIINGILLPFIIGILIYIFVDDFLKQKRNKSSNDFGTSYEKVEADYSIANTGPSKLYDSDVWFISVYRYYEEDRFKDYGTNDFPDDIVNIIFLDESLNVKKTLLDKDFLIINVNAPNKYSIESRYGNLKNLIFYLIVEGDTNSNDILDKEDVSCLYISKLDGGDFRKIVDKNVNGYRFVNENKIALTYIENEVIKYGIYNISENELKESKVLNDTMEKYHSN